MFRKPRFMPQEEGWQAVCFLDGPEQGNAYWWDIEWGQETIAIEVPTNRKLWSMSGEFVFETEDVVYKLLRIDSDGEHEYVLA